MAKKAGSAAARKEEDREYTVSTSGDDAEDTTPEEQEGHLEDVIAHEEGRPPRREETDDQETDDVVGEEEEEAGEEEDGEPDEGAGGEDEGEAADAAGEAGGEADDDAGEVPEDWKDTEIERLRQQVEDQSRFMLEHGVTRAEGGAVAHPATPPAGAAQQDVGVVPGDQLDAFQQALQQDQTLVTPEQYEQAMGSHEAYNAHINQVQRNVINHMLQFFPSMVNRAVVHQTTVQRASDEFFEQNDDLARYRQTCARIADEVEHSPDFAGKPLDAIFDETERRARVELGLPRKKTPPPERGKVVARKRVAQPGPARRKPGFAARAGGARRRVAPVGAQKPKRKANVKWEDTTEEAQIGAMDDLLDAEEKRMAGD